MKSIWLRIKLLYYLIRVSKNPQDTTAALSIGPCLFKLGFVKQALTKLNSNPVDAEFIKNRHIIKKLNLQELSRCPKDSLGYVFANHMLSNNLDPEFYGRVVVTNDESYIIMRLRQTHDLWHVILGFTTSVEDEIALQAFMFAQTYTPFANIVIGGAIFRVGFTNNPEAPLVFDSVSKGWLLGKNTKSIFSLNWEENWNTPLEQLRADYGITNSQNVQTS